MAHGHPMTNLIYKILTDEQWSEMQSSGKLIGAPVDLADGYIHFSTTEQVAETAAKHFSGQTDLRLVAVNAAQLGDKLRWEPSRGGALFPHLYAHLDMDAVVNHWPLPLAEDGLHIFPDGVSSQS